MSKQERFIKEIMNLQTQLIEIKNHEIRLQSQRVHLTEQQEKNMFFARMGGQFERLDSNRISSQDAIFAKRERRNSDIESMLNKIPLKYESQSAAFRTPPPGSPHQNKKSESMDIKPLQVNSPSLRVNQSPLRITESPQSSPSMLRKLLSKSSNPVQ